MNSNLEEIMSMLDEIFPDEELAWQAQTDELCELLNQATQRTPSPAPLPAASLPALIPLPLHDDVTFCTINETL